MLSRVAESLYWMNRYVERAENVARFIHVNLQLELDTPSMDDSVGTNRQWQPLVWTSGDEKLFFARYPVMTRKDVIQFLTFDLENPNSILSCIGQARENARSIREVISSEMWFTLNRFYLMLSDRQVPPRAFNDSHTFYTDIKTSCALFIGESMTTMSHNEGWHFGRVGRMLERAEKTSRILDVKYYILLPATESVGMPIDMLQWIALLKSASAFEMFRKQFSSITPRNVANFLLFNRDFPRAAFHCLMTAQESICAITGSASEAENLAQQQLKALCEEVNKTQIEDVINQGLHQYVDAFQSRLNQTDDAIYRTFFQILSDVPTTPVRADA